MPILASCAINGLSMRASACHGLAIAVVVGLASASVVRAEGSLDIAWLAPEGCPSAESVSSEIDELLGGAAGTRAGEHLSVRAMVARGERWLVTLETQTGAASGHRSIEATSCQGLASATALIVALMIDPDAVAAHAGKGAEMAPAPPPSPATPQPAVPPARAARSTFGIAGAGAAGDLGVLPGPDVGPGAALGLLLGHWRLELRVAYGVREVPSDTLADASGAYGKFRFYAGTLAGCWTALRGAVDFGPCVEAELGAVHGEGAGADHNRGQTTPWFALGAGGVVIFKATPWLHFPVHIDAVLPMWRPNFMVQHADGSLFRAWPVGGRLTAGVELQF